MTEDYEILPHQLLSDLKYDVESLKKKLMEPDAKSNELILEIESLRESIHELTSIFKRTLEDVKKDDTEKKVKALNDKIKMVVSQNETIARGMVAISDKLENFMKTSSGIPPPPSIPKTKPQILSQSNNFPPPPPSMAGTSKRERKGIFG